MDNSIHVIPFSGEPLKFEVSGGTGESTVKRTRGQPKTKSNKQTKEQPKQSKQSKEQSSNSGCGNFLLRASDNGFFVGEENYAVERVVEMLLGGMMTRERLPVLFYGQSGTGKTHLLQGIFASRRKRAVKRQKDVFINASDFARFFTEAIDLKATDDFRRRFREVTMLLVDDIERMEGKAAVLEEFQHTLDVLVSGDIPVILTSRVLPKFPQPLFDRIIGGTSIPIMLPDFAVRRHFIGLLISAFRISVSDSAALFAARELALSIPAIYGVIAGMVCRAMADDVKVDTSYFKQFIKNRGETIRPTIEQIVKTVANYFSFKVSELKGGSRNKTVAMARALAVYLARRDSGLTLKQIATFFGNRDQSTIRHLIEKIENNKKNDTTIKSQITIITEKINNIKTHLK
ncbi:MAG: AAA family ATPase [Planctomycetaceae bacterium]|jgi:chromosomal replication initiator protein|nr:AAA family ATPase [Planctomycetaceae bacterium]